MRGWDTPLFRWVLLSAKKWNERYDNKPPHLSQDIWNEDLWRFRVDNKIRVFTIFDESPQDEVIGYVPWVDLTHRSGS